MMIGDENDNTTTFTGQENVPISFIKTKRSSLGTLAEALDLSIEELLELKILPDESIDTGKPNRKTYLETGLPGSIQKAIEDYIQGEKEH